MIFLKRLFFLTTLISLTAFAQSEAPPVVFDKELIQYKILKAIAFDADQVFKDMGLKVHSCKIKTTKKEYVFNSLGNCLLVAIDSSIKNQNYSSVKLWVLNDQGQYLPPLLINWRVAQTSWLKFIYEFVELAYEDFFNSFRKKNLKDNVCAIPSTDFLSNDLGNFIGHLEIRTVMPWKLSNYFTEADFFKTRQFKNVNGMELTVKSPEYIDRKKIYELQLAMNNSSQSTEEDSSLVLNLRSNYNLILKRDFCLSGRFELVNSNGVRP